MSIDIKAPTFPESIADGTVATWHKKPGESVSRDELIVDIETDKVVLEVVAPADGTLAEILKQEGETVLSGELIGRFNTGKVAAGASTQMAGQAATAPSTQAPIAEQKLAPAARKLIEERQLDAGAIAATGKGGLITKEDVLKHLSDSATAAKAEPAPAAPKAAAAPADTAARGEREEK